MVSQNSEFTRKLRAAVRAKIEEFGIDVDDELPDYVMIMVGNKKDKTRMKADLKLFLGDKTANFVDWLFGFFQKVKTATSVVNSSTTAQSEPVDLKEDSAVKKQGVSAGESTSAISTATKRLEERKSRPSEIKSKSSNSPAIQPSKLGKKNLEIIERHKQKRPSSRSRSGSIDVRSLSPPQKYKNQCVHQNQEIQQPKRRLFALRTPTYTKRLRVSPDRGVVCSNGNPSLRSVAVIPYPFPITAHPRITALSRTPSPAESEQEREISSISKVLITEELGSPAQHPSSLNVAAAINQLDVKSVATTKEEEKGTGEKKRPSIRVIRMLDDQKSPANRQQPEIPQEEYQQRRRRLIALEPEGGGGLTMFQRAVGKTTTRKQPTMIVRPLLRVMQVTENGANSTVDTREGDEGEKAKKSDRKMLNPDGIGGVASLFRRAIAEAANIPPSLVAEERTGERALKRKEDEEKTAFDEENGGKRNRVIEAEETNGATVAIEVAEEDGVQRCGEEEVLKIDMSGRNRRRGAREFEIRHQKQPRTMLALVKQHIGDHQQTRRTSNLKESCNIETNQIGQKMQLKRLNTPGTTSAPIWDGRIEINDLSSTDDEAEIDAFLEDAQKLRREALEKELPPTSQLSRPILFQPEGTLSSSDAALLPAVTFVQHSPSGASLSHPQSTQLVQNDAHHSSLIARPHATVAPTTTVQTAPATICARPQYNYNQQQQNFVSPHHQLPYTPGYVVPTTQSISHRYQLMRPQMSKRYSSTNSVGTSLVVQTLAQLREQHKNKTGLLQKRLEEQRMLLSQLQKIPGADRRRDLMFRVRKLDAPIAQLKGDLTSLNEQITTVTKK